MTAVYVILYVLLGTPNPTGTHCAKPGESVETRGGPVPCARVDKWASRLADALGVSSPSSESVPTTSEISNGF